MDSGRREAVLAMADALDTAAERFAVVCGYSRSGYEDLAQFANQAWAVVAVAEAVVAHEWDRAIHGPWIFRDGDEI